MDFTAIASELETNFFTTGFGVHADYSPASLVELDAFMDEVWGTAGKLAEDPRATLDEEQYSVVINYGAYVGEVIRRNCGGEWRVQKPLHMSTISFPNNQNILPLNKVGKRLLHGSEDALFPIYVLACRASPPLTDASESFLAHAERFATACPLARHRVDAIVARLRAFAAPAAPGAKPAPGTRLAACPRCTRPASPGRIACIYCGGPLVVPRTCPQCARPNGLQARACMYCKAAL